MTTIDANRMATFVRVVELGSFTAAAGALGLPPSSVSRAVAKLEDELGVRLLHRTTRKLALTEAGRIYFDRMQPVVTEIDEASEAVAGLVREPRGLVRVTAPAAMTQLAAIAAELLAAHPGIALELTLTNRHVDLVEEGIDLAIRAGRLDDSTLVVRKIADSDLGLFASPGYLERRGRPRSVADLARHECIVFRSRTGFVPWRLEGPRGVEEVAVNGRLRADDMTFMVDAAVAGIGVALLPIAPFVTLGTGKGLVRLLSRYAVRGGALHLVWPSRKFLPARVALVRDFLATALAKFFRPDVDPFVRARRAAGA